MDFKEYGSNILRPISADEPCGSNPKYETLYEGIRGEVAKMSGIGHGAPDWNKVELDSMEMLTNQSKEINLVAYLVSAMTVNHDLEGMVYGFEFMIEFLRTFWDGMFPPLKKEKIRARAVSWLNDRVMERKEIFLVQDRELVERALLSVKNLKTTVYDLFKEPPTKFSGIRSAIEEHLATLPEPAAPQEEASTPSEEEGQPAAAPSSATGPQTDMEASDSAGQDAAPKPTSAPSQAAVSVSAPAFDNVDVENLKSLKNSLLPLATELLKAAPTMALPYVLNREAVWLQAKTPKHQSGQTMVPAPAPEIRDSLKTMNAKGSWQDLLLRCEALLPRWPFWLDLQYYAAQGASQLGDSYIEVLQVIQFQSKRLFTKLSDLQKLKFDDGTAFATSATKSWLAEISVEGGGGRQPRPEEEFAKFLAEKGNQDLSGCLEEAEKRIRQASSPREQFLFRTEMAKFYFEQEQYFWSLAILNVQKRTLEQFQIETWEPGICGPVWSLILEILPQIPQETPNLREMAEEARTHLAATRMDLTADHQLGIN